MANDAQSTTPRLDPQRRCTPCTGADGDRSSQADRRYTCSAIKGTEWPFRISPEMALKIEDWLGVEHGGRAEMWTGMQLDYDMWQARRKRKVA